MANRDENVSLDVLYAPSAWSTRLSSDVIVDKHIEVLREGESAHCPILLKSETSQLICSFSNSAGTRPAEVWAEHSVWCREWAAAGYLLPQPSSCNCRTGYSHIIFFFCFMAGHIACAVSYINRVWTALSTEHSEQFLSDKFWIKFCQCGMHAGIHPLYLLHNNRIMYHNNYDSSSTLCLLSGGCSWEPIISYYCMLFSKIRSYLYSFNYCMLSWKHQFCCLLNS